MEATLQMSKVLSLNELVCEDLIHDAEAEYVRRPLFAPGLAPRCAAALLLLSLSRARPYIARSLVRMSSGCARHYSLAVQRDDLYVGGMSSVFKGIYAYYKSMTELYKALSYLFQFCTGRGYACWNHPVVGRHLFHFPCFRSLVNASHAAPLPSPRAKGKHVFPTPLDCSPIRH